MPRSKVPTHQFNAGLLGRLIDGRTDFEKYYAGFYDGQNAIPLPQGALIRRGGTVYVCNTKSDGEVILVPFAFNQSQSYIFELGASYVRFITNRSQIAGPYEVAHSYTLAQLQAAHYLAKGDTTYIFHKDVQTSILQRTGASTFAISDYDFDGGPFLSENTTATTLAPSAVTGTGVTMTASAVTGINDDTGFQTTDVGRLIRWRQNTGTGWGVFKITSRSSTTVVTGDWQYAPATGAAAASTEWALGLFSDTTGWPSTGTFYQDRLVVNGGPAKPLGVEMSRTGSYADFTSNDPDDESVLDDHAISITIDGEQNDPILWLASASRGLHLGTAGSEHIVFASDLNEVVKPSNANQKPVSGHGSSGVQPIALGNSTLFVDASEEKVREFSYDFARDEDLAKDTTLVVPEVGFPKIKQSAWQKSPYRIMWNVMDDGTVAALGYDRDNGIANWHKHVMGGTDVEVESVAAIPGTDGRTDVYFAVKRTVNSATVRFIEYKALERRPADAAADVCYPDAAVKGTQASSTTISGLTHLVGETVVVYTDGYRQLDCVVDGSGEIEVEYAAEDYVVGLSAPAWFATMTPEQPQAQGPSLGDKQRIAAADVLVAATRDLKIGGTYAGVKQIGELSQKTVNDTPTAPSPLFDGWFHVSAIAAAHQSRTPRLYFYTDGPFPFSVVGLKQHVDNRTA